MERRIAILDAPSNLGLRPPRPGAVPGVARMPQAFRDRRLLERLRARDAGRLEPPAYSPEPDMTTGYRNGTSLRTYSEGLAVRVRDLVRSGEFPVVVGGDCSVLLGAMLGLKSIGRYGLVFIDGHDDFSPVREPEKYRGLLAAAGSDLALVTGHGPDSLGNLQGAKPYVREEDVVLFGFYRDPSDSKDFATEKLDTTEFHQFPIERVRATGVRAAAEEAVRRLESKALDGFWIHVDADVLDRSVMPAVDSPNASGFLHGELTEVLRTFLTSPKAAGIEFTIYDPDLDPKGVYGDQLVKSIVRAFRPIVPSGPRSRSPDPRATPPMIKELVAPGPFGGFAEQLGLYGQFVGDWEFDMTEYAKDGTRDTAHGEWHFGWVLEGRAVEDIWMVPTRAEREKTGAGPSGIGLTIRIFDPKTDSWQVTWLGGLGGPVFSMTGRQQGEEIVQEGRGPDGLITRWIFSRITPEAFHWRSVTSPDEGKTWRLEQEMSVRRGPGTVPSEGAP